MTGRSALADALERTGSTELPSSPPVPYSLPRPGRRQQAMRDDGLASGDIPRDARIFLAVAVILWAMVALEIVVLASVRL